MTLTEKQRKELMNGAAECHELVHKILLELEPLFRDTKEMSPRMFPLAFVVLAKSWFDRLEAPFNFGDLVETAEQLELLYEKLRSEEGITH